MAVDAVGANSTLVGIKNTIKPINEDEKQGIDTSSEIEEEKSTAAKYMIGATALAAVIGLGIAGYKGKLGKGIQRALGGAERDIKPAGQNITPEVPRPSGKSPEPIESPKPDTQIEKPLGETTEIKPSVEPVISPKSETLTEKPLEDTAEINPDLDPVVSPKSENPLEDTIEVKPEVEPSGKVETEPDVEIEPEIGANADAEIDPKAKDKTFIGRCKHGLVQKFTDAKDLLKKFIRNLLGK